ncbi:MAG: kinase [Gammaproteobacteria bacterium]|nr:kinase [Gammaproteobacteria bacterium]
MLAEPLLAALSLRLVPRVLLGISGAPGSGKSTLAQALVAAAQRHGVAALALSLDDFYHGRAERLRLARAVHPLLATRGVPGTHDLDLLLATLDALNAASPRRPAPVPRFDKGRDTRHPPSRWRRITRSPQLLVLEGWCLGLPAQPAQALRRPLNALERNEDADGHWRCWVNARLAEYARRLWPCLNPLLLLQAPGWTAVCRWRDEAERPLRRAAAPRALDRTALRRFLQHYERLTRHALNCLPARADWLIVLDGQRRVHAVRRRR